MPWESRIESEGKRRWVVAGIMLLLLCLTTGGAVLLASYRNGDYEVEETRLETLGHYTFELPDSMISSEDRVELVETKGVETKVLGQYVLGDEKQLSLSVMTLVEMKFERAMMLGQVHDLVRKQFEFPRTRLITDWAINPQMTGYLDGGRYREAFGGGEFLSTMFNYTTMTIDSKTFVCVVHTVVGEEVTEYDYNRFKAVMMSLRDMRFEDVKVNEAGRVEVGEFSVGKVPGSRVIRMREGKGNARQVVFISDGGRQPFTIEVRGLPLTIEGGEGDGNDEQVVEVKLEDLAKVIGNKLFEGKPPKGVNWVKGPMGEYEVAALDLSKLTGGSGFVQRVYVLKLDQDYGVLVKTKSPTGLANSVAQEVVRMVGGIAFKGGAKGKD